MATAKKLLYLSALVASNLVAADSSQFRLTDPNTSFELPEANTVIQWGTCNEDFGSPIPVDCGRLFVPLDYTDPDSQKTLSLELLRVPSPTQPAKGSILFNFGGPGIVGRSSLAKTGALLQVLTGGEHNLIAFDPRGTGSTLPFKCYDDPYEMMLFSHAQSVLPDVTQEDALGKLWARGTIDAKACANKHNETGRLIGTAFTARDIMKVAEALGEDGMLRYWGFSYGTTLGATLVAMFPDKVDKVILDGVQNPHQYYHADADYEEWTQTDEVFSAVFEHCLENPSECPLARHGKTAAELEESVWNLLDTVKYHPVPVNQTIIDKSVLQAVIDTAMYSTESWKPLATMFDMLLTGEIDDDFILALVRGAGFPLEEADVLAQNAMMFSLGGIHCSERLVRAKSYEDFLPSMYRLYNTSRVIASASVSAAMTCAQWKLDAKEVYQGDFRVRPKNPVLIVGNSWDGHTPIKSAHNVSSGFEGSVVLEIQGYGHASLRLPSLCSYKTMSDYWLHGKLPQPGTVCKVDAPPYSNKTWFDIIKSSGKDMFYMKELEAYFSGGF